MTGLDVEICHLLEVACIITDDQLNVIAKVWITTSPSCIYLFTYSQTNILLSHFAALFIFNIKQK